MDPIISSVYSYDHKLSDHFTVGEFIISQTAIRLGIDNEPSENHVKNMKFLSQNILEPIRYKFGPIFISSGLRCEKLNEKIGGSVTSQHCFGEAADFKVVGHTLKEVYKWIIVESDINYDQIIFEGNWIHISYTTRYENRIKNTVVNFKNGKAFYRHFSKEQIKQGINYKIVI